MIITQTPYRVSLAGGGTDFPDFYRAHGGCVVTAAIVDTLKVKPDSVPTLAS